MKKFLIFSTVVTLGLIIEGCLVGHRIAYEIVPEKSGKGTARVLYADIRSDAADAQSLEEDRKNLFDYMTKSPKFLADMKKQGKNITSRELFLDEGKLNGRAVYKFDKLSDVENLTYADGFYFITLAIDDSVLATNGELIKSTDYKRLLWRNDVDTLKFQILTEPVENTPLKSLAAYYRK